MRCNPRQSECHDDAGRVKSRPNLCVPGVPNNPENDMLHSSAKKGMNQDAVISIMHAWGTPVDNNYSSRFI